jgi:predicted ribosome quality control (RQC) complex YloA/Tae2 family protein
LDGLTLYKISRILNSKLKNAVLNKISLLENTFYLEFYAEKKINLSIRINGNDSSIFLSENTLSIKHQFLKNLNGSRLEKIKTRGYDRLIYIDLKKRKPSGKFISYKIVVEFLGRNSNLFVLNELDKIIFRMNNNNSDTDRSIDIGKPYNPFKLNKRWDLDNPGEAIDFIDLVGFYPKNAKKAKEVTADINDFNEACRYIKQLINADDYFYLDPQNILFPFKILEPYQSISLEELNKLKKKTDNFMDRKDKISKFFHKEIRKNKDILKKLELELEDAENYRRYIEEADLLKNNLNLIMNNSGLLVLNLYKEDSVEKVEYNVDPLINYENHINKLYKKAQKKKKSIVKIKERMSDIESVILNLEDELFYLGSLSEEDINKIYVKIFKKDIKFKSAEQNNRFMKFCYKDVEYFVGKNSLQNHELVFKFARQNDYWFHAQKIPSAHLILRKNGKPNDEEIEIAAKIVAFYSKYKNENKVPVDYTLKKYVKKPKYTSSGFVIYSKFRTIIIKPYFIEEISELSCN